MEQINKGQNYGKLTRAVSIMIVDFEFVRTDSAFHHRFRLHDRKNDVEYSDALEVNVLEIPKVQKDETSPVSTWLRFFTAKTKDEFMSLAQTSPAMEEAWGVIKELSADERERLLAEDREKTRRDKAAYYETGLVEGRAEGRMEERKNLVANMLAQGVSPEQISSFTGLTLGDAKALAKKDRG